MRLLIIRHGDPDYEIDGLTEKGKVEVKLLTERLKKEKMEHIYVSPLGRARATAAPSLEMLGREEKICEWLREFRSPVTWDDGTERNIVWDMYPSMWTKKEAYFDRESWKKDSVMQSGDIEKEYNWVVTGLDHLLKRHGYRREDNLYRVEKENQDTIAFFCHFGVECVILSHLLNISPVLLWHGMVASPTGVTSLCTEEREQGIAYFRMNYFGDVSHLTHAGEEVSFQARYCEVYSDMSKRH